MTIDRPGHPHASSALARFLDRRIGEFRGLKTQREIAAAAGFNKPNIISMLKTGETQLPLERVLALARALDVDPVHLLRLAMTDRSPELGAIFDEITGRRLASVNEETILLTKWRLATNDNDPAPNPQIEAAVDAMLAAVK